MSLEQLQLASIVASRSKAEPIGTNQFFLPHCPFCGKDNGKHVSSRFGQTNVGVFFKCFSCGEACSIQTLGETLGVLARNESITPEEVSKVKIVFSEPKDPDWWESRYDLLESYQKNGQVYSKWAMCGKRIRPDEVVKYQLGYGTLPNGYDERIIVPIFSGDDLIGFRGRDVDNHSQLKWMSTDNKILSSLEKPPFYNHLSEYKHLLIVENMVDAILVNERTPYNAIPTMSVVYWNDLWFEEIRKLNPVSIIVAYDKDIYGNGSNAKEMRNFTHSALTRKGLDVERVTGIKYTDENILVRYVDSSDNSYTHKLPLPHGIKLVKRLRKEKMGCPIHLADWSNIEATDIGELLTK